LYELLKQHPQVGLSRFKETHFFNRHWDEGLDWYREKFAHLPADCRSVGEITPAYHRFPEVIPRIQQTLGNPIKILILLREPRQRAFSHYVHDFARHQEKTDLVYKRYLATTHYARAIHRYQEAFGRENCLALVFEEDFLPNQQRMMDNVCDFIGVPHHAITPVHSNPSCLPVTSWSPDTPSRLAFGQQEVDVPARSLVVYTGQRDTTRILAGISPAAAEPLIQRIQQAVSFIPAVKSSIIFEQNVKDELIRVEQLIQRNLDIWRLPLGDLRARLAPTPVFLPA